MPHGHVFVEHTKSGRIFCTRCGEFRGADADVGVIAMWTGALSSLPAAWQLCDGTNGTPDLRDKFVVGSGGGYVQGSVGGSIHCKLALENLPAHSHDKNPDGIREVPIVEETVSLGESNAHCVVTETKKVASEPFCKKQDCREWPLCCDANNPNYQYYQRQGHEKVVPAPLNVYTRPKYRAKTGVCGEADPKPIDVRPPFYAVAFIMRMRY